MTTTKLKAAIAIVRNWIDFETDERRDEMDLRDIGHEWARGVENRLGEAGFVADVMLEHGNERGKLSIFANVEGVQFWPTGQFDLTPKYVADRLESTIDEMERYAEDMGDDFDREAMEAEFLRAAREALEAADKCL